MPYIKVSFKSLPGDKLESWEFEVSGPDEDFVKKEMDALQQLLFPKPKTTDTIAAGRRIIRRSWYHAWKANYHARGSKLGPIIVPVEFCSKCYFGSGRFSGHVGKHWNYKSKYQKPKKHY